MFNRYLLLALSAIFILTNTDNSLLFGQSISGIEILPENPTNSDEVQLIVHTEFEFDECHLDSIVPYFACGAFTYNAFYSSNFTTDTCSRSDTVSLGVLTNGLYIISYRMYFFGWTQVDQLDTSIVVGTTGIGQADHQNEKAQLKIWPNPSIGKVHIRCDIPEIDKLMIHSMTGRQIMSLSNENASEIWQNTISLQAGEYICTAYRNNLPVEVSKIIVTD